MLSFKKYVSQSVILMVVRWYVAYALSDWSIIEMTVERSIKVDYVIVNR